MIQIDPEIKSCCPNIKLGIITGRVIVTEPIEQLWSEFESVLYEKSQLSFEEVKEIPPLLQARESYKKLGKDPSRYRLSAEALHRRLIKGRSLYRVNNVVDILNLISLQSGYSIGGYDKSKIDFPIVLKKAKAEPYRAIGRGELNIENLPVLYDKSGPFGSPTSDSERTIIDLNTREILWVFFNFAGNDDLLLWLEKSVQLLERFASASEVNNLII